jgi:hypothetical protein
LAIQLTVLPNLSSVVQWMQDGTNSETLQGLKILPVEPIVIMMLQAVSQSSFLLAVRYSDHIYLPPEMGPYNRGIDQHFRFCESRLNSVRSQQMLGPN